MIDLDAVRVAAEHIVGHTPPPWLLLWLKRVAIGVYGGTVAERDYPTRGELRSRLQGISDAARLIISEIEDQVILAQLEASGAPPLLLREHKALERIVRVADAAAERIPSGAGAGKYLITKRDGLSPEQMCAMAVMAAWRVFRDEWPPVIRHPAVQRACESLFAAAGGNVARRGGSKATLDGFWRKQLRYVRANLDSSSMRQLLAMATKVRGIESPG